MLKGTYSDTMNNREKGRVKNIKNKRGPKRYSCETPEVIPFLEEF